MFGLRDLLFGKKVKVTTQLGIFEGRVKKNNTKEILWDSDANSELRDKVVTLLLLGNAKGPYQSVIESTQLILKDEDNIKAQIVAKILKDIKLQQKFQDQKTADFRLTCISAIRKNEVFYELSYESENGGYIGAIFREYTISEVYFEIL